MIRNLYYGDNLDVIPSSVQEESVDLVYLDPPFNSDANYNVLFKSDGLHQDEAQMMAFKDTWLWDFAAQKSYDDLQGYPNVQLVNVVNAMYSFLGMSPMMSYLVNMAVRIVEIHKALKPTGSCYLHCDPTASHYLKLLMDQIFRPENFRSEIIWRRTGSHNKMRRWAPIHDVILFYTKSSKFTWNNPRQPYMNGHVKQYFVADGSGGYRTNYYGNVLTGSGTRNGESGEVWQGFDPTAKGRHWAIPGQIWDEVGIDPDGLSQHEKLDLLLKEGFIKIVPGQAWPIYELKVKPESGPASSDIWSFQPYTDGCVYGTRAGIDEDVRWLSPQDAERLGYPTQKPVGLLSRIIEASSKPGDLVMDPFCGCGTTIEAAERLSRQWIGIDISPFAIQLVQKVRVQAAFPGLKVGVDYIVAGLPTTLAGAQLMAEGDKKAFEIWAVSYLDGIPNEKKGADKGIDGRLPFRPDGKTAKFAVISVKGGKLKADDIRSLSMVAKREENTSEGFGILICLSSPSKGMLSDAASAGTRKIGGKDYPLVQIITVEDMLKGKKPSLPLLDPSLAFRKAAKFTKNTQGSLEI